MKGQTKESHWRICRIKPSKFTKIFHKARPMRDALVVEQIQSNKHMQTPLCEAHRARRRRRRKGRLVADENIQQQYRVFTAKRNRDTPSYFFTLCTDREPHLAEDRRAASWLDGTFRCTAFVTNHCCCGERGGKRCHVSCFLRLHATSHFEVRLVKVFLRCCATLCFLAYLGTFQSTKHGGENGEHPDD